VGKEAPFFAGDGEKRQFRPRCGIHGSWMIMVQIICRIVALDFLTYEI
jgi:hypothetical protein